MRYLPHFFVVWGTYVALAVTHEHVSNFWFGIIG